MYSQTCSHPLSTVKHALILYVQSDPLSSSMYSETCSHPLCTVKPALILYVQSNLLSHSMYSQTCSHPLCTVKPALILYVQSNLLSSSMYSQTCSHPLCKVNPAHVATSRAPDKLRICVFYAMKMSKNACIIRSECTFMHTYCCVSKLSKFGAYLYAVDDNTSCT
jgi:hypothetical protein